MQENLRNRKLTLHSMRQYNVQHMYSASTVPRTRDILTGTKVRNNIHIVFLAIS